MFKKKGSNNWWISIDGKNMTTGTPNKGLAQKIESKVRLGLAGSEHFQQRKDSNITISELLDMYDQKHSTLNKSEAVRKNETYMIRRFRNSMGKIKAKTLTPEMIEQYMGDRRTEGKVVRLKNGKLKRTGDISEVTIHHEMNLVRHAFLLAKTKWRILNHTPFEFVTLPKGDKQRKRFMSVQEADKVVSECPDWLRPMVVIGLDTGLRISNIACLKWSQVDLFQRVINIPKTKNDDPVCIPMTDRVFVLLKEFQKESKVSINWVLGKPYKRNQISKGFKRVIRKLGMDEEITFHSIRHTFCSHMAIQGANLNDIATLAGHRDLRSAKRYSHLNTERKREVIKQLEMSRKM